MKVAVRLAVLVAVASVPATAQADVIAPKVVTPKVVTPTVVTPTTTAPQVTPPSTPSPAPAVRDSGASGPTAPSQSEGSDQYFEPQAARAAAPTPRTWEKVKDAHDDLEAVFSTTWQSDFAAALAGRVALTANEIVASAILEDAFGGFALGPEKTGPGQVLANMLDADEWGRNPGGIADIIDNVFGTSTGPIQQTIDTQSPVSDSGQIPEGGGGQDPQSEKDEYGPKVEQ